MHSICCLQRYELYVFYLYCKSVFDLLHDVFRSTGRPRVNYNFEAEETDFLVNCMPSLNCVNCLEKNFFSTTCSIALWVEKSDNLFGACALFLLV